MLYKIYRYLNLVHALLHKSVSASLGPLNIEEDFVDKLGLLTENEAEVLLPTDNKERDAVIAWLGAEIATYLRMDGVDFEYANQEISASLRELRGLCATHHAAFNPW
eukprot:CAMPEP_0172488080 /NCGR_PEP_ID=MMETSP1066-20121228/17446_1 /TAXON_ID=671091 /ORGANISM="Coscinodiscus wailesii, Strain CCMP2513" /LENGTH=106 /DNA_ID=CAMNT_0013255073 /DNA_START=101 /DNA_END=424 /DNA_ORIENTATION=+